MSDIDAGWVTGKAPECCYCGRKVARDQAVFGSTAGIWHPTCDPIVVNPDGTIAVRTMVGVVAFTASPTDASELAAITEKWPEYKANRDRWYKVLWERRIFQAMNLTDDQKKTIASVMAIHGENISDEWRRDYDKQETELAALRERVAELEKECLRWKLEDTSNQNRLETSSGIIRHLQEALTAHNDDLRSAFTAAQRDAAHDITGTSSYRIMADSFFKTLSTYHNISNQDRAALQSAQTDGGE